MNNLDYVIEPTKDGGFFAYFRCNVQSKTYAATLGEALDKLIENINGYMDGMYLVEEYN
jgi:predicted RNase H-like HicB family nuclease